MAFFVSSLYRIRCSSNGSASVFRAYKNSSKLYNHLYPFKTAVCSYSSTRDVVTSQQTFTNNESDQISNLRGQEVEFDPSRAQDVFQNAVEEVSHNPETGFKETQDNGKDDKEHLAAYQCATNVHLNAVMQSMVPEPFTTKGKAPVHLNMPGGTWSRGQKYLSDHQQGSHEMTLKHTDFQIQSKKDCHTQASAATQEGLTQREKLKLIIKDYGSTVLVFHVGMSLCSVGIFYLAVSSGLDVGALLTKIGMSSNNFAVGGSTFVVAYAVHKVFAPLRIAITLSVTPFLVRYLRRVGILKIPKANN